MKLLPYTELFKYAKAHKITIPAMNTFNMSSMQGVVRAANAVRCPVIIQTQQLDMEAMGEKYAVGIAKAAAEEAEVPVALGLDHGISLDQVKRCINAGYSSVMIDLNNLDYDENVKGTKEVVAYAHGCGVAVEAELGSIQKGSASYSEIESTYTDPLMAKSFVKETGIDCLAVAVGNAHGAYKFSPKINFDLLGELLETVNCPLVIHGGSGIPEEDMLRMVKMGVLKFNVGTDLFRAYRTALEETLKEEGTYRLSKLDTVTKEAVQKVAEEKMNIFTRYRI